MAELSSVVVRKGPCESCTSSDACAVYDDGHTKCYSCGTFTPPTNNRNRTETKIVTKPSPTQSSTLPPLPSEFYPLKDRGIFEEVAKKYQVTVNQGESKIKHIYPYFDRNTGEYIAAKHRSHTKKFMWKGDASSAGLFGQQLFPPNSAKYITVVEGELDAMAAYQMQGQRYPTVSVKSAATAPKDCAENYEYLNSFENIVIVFDKDEGKFNPKTGQTHYPGQEAARTVAKMFPIGKVKLVTLNQHKDPNDYLLEGKAKAFMKEWWDTPTYTPTGLVVAKDLWEEVKTPKESNEHWPWSNLNALTYGIRPSESVVVTAPSGVGKTSFLKETEHHILQSDPSFKLGLLHLEESNADTALALMSISANKPLHLPDVRGSIDEEELKKYYEETLNNDRIILWDHYGSNSIEEVVSNIRYMKAMGCTHIILDHISILMSDQSGDERKQLDEAMTKLSTLCREINVALILVAHLSRNGQIRGTAGIEQLADIVIKLDRDKTAKNDFIRNTTYVEVQKNRFSGRTGPAGYLRYVPETGRLKQLTPEEQNAFEEGRPLEEFTFEKREEDWND